MDPVDYEPVIGPLDLLRRILKQVRKGSRWCQRRCHEVTERLAHNGLLAHNARPRSGHRDLVARAQPLHVYIRYGVVVWQEGCTEQANDARIAVVQLRHSVEEMCNEARAARHGPSGNCGGGRAAFA